MSRSVYVLGHQKHELERLIRQSEFLGELSEHLLRKAGLRAGMSVLDVGCGAGDLSMLAAGLVGPTGRVVGVDRSPDSIALASARAVDAQLTNVRFVVGDAASCTMHEPVDAVIGRLVMMYFPDPVAVLRHLMTLIKPGGVIAFQDFDLHGVKSEPICPLFEISIERLRRTFAAGGNETRMGLKIGRVYEDAGLPSPEILMVSRPQRGPDSFAPEMIADVARTILPMMERFGVASADDIGIDTLRERLLAEALQMRATQFPPPLVGAWAHTPA